MCKLCDYELKYSTSTAGMSYHIRTGHREEFLHEQELPVAARGHTTKQTNKGKSIMKSYIHAKRTLDQTCSNWKHITRLLARFVITSNSPISVIENQQLKEFLDSVCEPKYILPSAHFLKNNIMLAMLGETEKILKLCWLKYKL